MSCISMKGTIYKFKKQNSLEVRKKESRRILGKFSDRIPIIVEKSHGDLPELDKKKFLAPLDLTMGSFIYIIRKRIKLNAEHALFLFINGLLVSNSETIGHIYHQHKDEDGFLYVMYAAENTFGGYGTDIIYWGGLGVCSTVGLGFGVPTGTLYVFPEVCLGKMTMLNTMIWGAGAAIGELPPYLLCNKMVNKLDKYIDVKRYERYLKKWGIPVVFTMAIWPSGTFDACGILCGLVKMPIYKFLGATLTGKMLFRAPMQHYFYRYICQGHDISQWEDSLYIFQRIVMGLVLLGFFINLCLKRFFGIRFGLTRNIKLT